MRQNLLKTFEAILAIGICVLLFQLAFGGSFSYFKAFERSDFTFSQDADTVWFPIGLNAKNLDFLHMGMEFKILQADTLFSDSIQLDIYSGMVPNTDSASIVYSFSATIGQNNDTTTARWWYDYPDSLGSSASDWPNQYWWVRMIHMIQVTTDAETLTVNGDCWSSVRGDSMVDWYTTKIDTEIIVPTRDGWGATGDSMKDWHPSTGSTMEGVIDEGIGSLDTSDYIYVRGSDTVAVIAFADYATGQAELPQKIKLTVVAGECSVTVAPDTLAFGIAFGDTSLHHYDSLVTASFGSAILDTIVDTLYYEWELSPSSETFWTTDEIDSLLLVVSSAHVDTTVNGDKGFLKIYAVDLTPVYSSTFESEIDEGLANVSYSDYVYPIGSGWMTAFSCEARSDTLVKHNSADSLVVKFRAFVDSTMTRGTCLIKVAVAIGDTSKHHYDSLTVSDFETVIIWKDTATYSASFTLAPSTASAFDTLRIDSVIVIFDAYDIDTTANGNYVRPKIFAIDVVPYYDQSLSPALKAQCWMLMKE